MIEITKQYYDELIDTLTLDFIICEDTDLFKRVDYYDYSGKGVCYEVHTRECNTDSWSVKYYASKN